MKLLFIEAFVIVSSLLISGVMLTVVAILMDLTRQWPGMKALVHAWAWGALPLACLELLIAWQS